MQIPIGPMHFTSMTSFSLSTLADTYYIFIPENDDHTCSRRIGRYNKVRDTKVLTVLAAVPTAKIEAFYASSNFHEIGITDTGFSVWLTLEITKCGEVRLVIENIHTFGQEHYRVSYYIKVQKIYPQLTDLRIYLFNGQRTVHRLVNQVGKSRTRDVR